VRPGGSQSDGPPGIATTPEPGNREFFRYSQGVSALHECIFGNTPVYNTRGTSDSTVRRSFHGKPGGRRSIAGEMHRISNATWPIPVHASLKPRCRLASNEFLNAAQRGHDRAAFVGRREVSMRVYGSLTIAGVAGVKLVAKTSQNAGTETMHVTFHQTIVTAT
jgi:hypothetical protein